MSVALDVPYISQIDWQGAVSPAGTGGSNCGPCCVAMQLAFRGVIPPTKDAMWEVADLARDGVSDDVGQTGAYTTFAQLRAVAASYGQASTLLWTWDAVRASLDAGEPVTLLVDNTVLVPRQYPVDPSFNAHHFILLTGYDEARSEAPTNDPLDVYEPVGPGAYTCWSVQQGATNVGGVQAMALVPVAVEDSIPMDTTADERAAMVPYFEQLGVRFNPETAIGKRACLAFKRGETRGPAVSGEYPAQAPNGRPSTRQKFTAGVAEAWQQDDGTWITNFVEVVMHPEAITG
jgi:hypothetical protein